MTFPRRNPVAALAAVAAAAGLLAACGYRLRGTGMFLPPSIKTMAVPMFKNLTTRFELDVRLTRAVIDEIVARGRVKIEPSAEAADAVLSGEITGFTANPLAFTSGQAAADRYSIRIDARVILRDRVNQKILFSNPSFIYMEEYEVPTGSDFESVETEAIGKVAEKFARSLVINMLEGF